MELHQLGAAEAARRIAAGTLTAEALMRACLDRVSVREPAVEAWAWLDPDQAMAAARTADHAPSRGPLHGVPVGLKDVIDTADMPTENGSPLHAGRQPAHDASVAAQLRAAGAVVMGKTVTTEFATYRPGKTRNPWHRAHTPGGSSSGSAAAVAAGMVPLAVGTQVTGSVIRPAAFCGVVGFKPTIGLVSRSGVLAQSDLINHMGGFARSVEDVALLTDAMAAFDPGDVASVPRGPARLHATAMQEPPRVPRFALVRTPNWNRAEPETRAVLDAVATLPGVIAEEVELPDDFAAAMDHQKTICEADIAWNFRFLTADDRRQVSERLQAVLASGERHTAVAYHAAVAARTRYRQYLAALFERYDALLTPASVGIAPASRDTTGDPLFCGTWTLCGVPALTLPTREPRSGLPLGVQLVGAPQDDARLLRCGRWLEVRIAASDRRPASG